MSYTINGYGIDISKLHLKENAAFLLLQDHMPEIIGEHYKDICSTENGEVMSLTPATAQMFADDYENDTYCYRGIYGLLTDIINEERNLTVYTFSFEDNCIYVPSHVPANNKDKAKMLTQEDIRRLLTAYLSIITDDPLHFAFLDIILP